MAFTAGDLIDGHYRVEKRHSGGMGFVYIVRDEVVGKRFAIKQLPELQAENKVLAERFRREASAWLLLDYHPNIVQAHSFHPRPEGPILILEYVDGPSLDRLLKAEKRLSPVQVVRYARQFCQAMSYAHSKPIPDRGVGVLHRDIKPANILISKSNQVKVTDFGLAKFEENETKLTGEGQFVGTIAYSSPEQLRSARKATKASDVYSLGAVMYQMLSGQSPFRAATPAELYRLIVQSSPLPVSELCEGLDPGLTGIVMRCLEKDPAQRFSDFSELDKALAGLEFLLKDRRDWSCAGCGYTSRSEASVCPVCEKVRSNSAGAVESAGWLCICGVRVPFSERTCQKCGRARASIPAGLEEDAPLPVSADLVLLPTSEEGSDPQPAKPSDTAWPGGMPAPASASASVTATAPESGSTPGPGDSNIGTPSAPSQATPKRLWDPSITQPFLLDLGSRERLLGWMLERSHYTIGRDAHMRIRLKDVEMAGYQLFLVRLACGWLAMNRAAGTRVEFNGWQSDQRLLRPGDIVRVGSTWLAYAGSGAAVPSLPPIPGGWLDRVGPSLQTVRSGGSAPTSVAAGGASCVIELPNGREVVTRGESVVIGSAPFCAIQLSDEAVAPVHALVSWQLDGPHLIQIAGSVKTAEAKPVSNKLLANGDSLWIGDAMVHVRVEGDATAPGRLRAADELSHPRRLALTVVAGPQKGQTALLPDDPATLGRHSDCDFSIPTDPYMSRRHLRLVARNGSIELTDLGSRHGFAIGQTNHTNSATARIGDVLRVGQSFFLVHCEME